MCEIPSPCFKAVFTRLLLGHSSLPPDFAPGFVQSRTLALTWYVQFFLLGDGFTAPSGRFCQQMCEIPSPCFNTVFTGLLLGHSSLPPDFARGFAQSRALALTRYVQFFCSVTASRLGRFCQQMCEIPSPCFNTVFTGFLLDHSSLPPDSARGFVQSRALAFTRYVQFFLLGEGFAVPSARFCQQRAEIPSPRFNAVFTGFLLGHSSLPPDFARGFVQSRALVFTRSQQVFCS